MKNQSTLSEITDQWLASIAMVFIGGFICVGIMICISDTVKHRHMAQNIYLSEHPILTAKAGE